MTDKPTTVLLVLFLTCSFANLARAEEPSTTQSQSAPAQAQSAPANKIAVIRIHGQIAESPPMLDIGLGDLPTGTLREWSGRIKRAASDKNVTALVLLIDQPIMGWAQMQELGPAIVQQQLGIKVLGQIGQKLIARGNLVD